MDVDDGIIDNDYNDYNGDDNNDEDYKPVCLLFIIKAHFKQCLLIFKESLLIQLIRLGSKNFFYF